MKKIFLSILMLATAGFAGQAYGMGSARAFAKKVFTPGFIAAGAALSGFNSMMHWYFNLHVNRSLESGTSTLPWEAKQDLRNFCAKQGYPLATIIDAEGTIFDSPNTLRLAQHNGETFVVIPEKERKALAGEKLSSISSIVPGEIILVELGKDHVTRALEREMDRLRHHDKKVRETVLHLSAPSIAVAARAAYVAGGAKNKFLGALAALSIGIIGNQVGAVFFSAQELRADRNATQTPTQVRKLAEYVLFRNAAYKNDPGVNSSERFHNEKRIVALNERYALLMEQGGRAALEEQYQRKIGLIEMGIKLGKIEEQSGKAEVELLKEAMPEVLKYYDENHKA